MLASNWLKHTGLKALAITATLSLFAAKNAEAFTADEVLNQMDEDQRRTYLSGLVDGLAQARWAADNSDQTGWACITDWYYNDLQTAWDSIDQWFERHLDKPAASLLYVLIDRECGP